MGKEAWQANGQERCWRNDTRTRYEAGWGILRHLRHPQTVLSVDVTPAYRSRHVSTWCTRHTTDIGREKYAQLAKPMPKVQSHRYQQMGRSLPANRPPDYTVSALITVPAYLLA